MSQQPKAAATQEQPPVASAGGGRGVQQGQNSSTGASTVKTSNQGATSGSKTSTANGGANLSWAARLAQANGGAKQRPPPEDRQPTSSTENASAKQPVAQQQRQSSGTSSRSTATSGVKLPVGVSAATGKDINFGSFDPSELQQPPQPPKDASGNKPSPKGSFAAAGSNKHVPPPPAPPVAPIATGQRPYGSGQTGRPHRAQPVQAVQIPQGGSYAQQPFVTVPSLYSRQPYVQPSAYMPSPGPGGFYTGGFQAQYPTGYYGNQAQSPSGVPASGTPTGQASVVTGASGATQYGSTPSSPLPVKPPTQPPVRQKKILRIENPDTHEVLNLDAFASEVNKQDKEEKAAAAASAESAAPAEEGKDGKSFKDAMLAAVAAVAKPEEPKAQEEVAKVEEMPAVEAVEEKAPVPEEPAAPEEPAEPEEPAHVSEESSTTAIASVSPFASEEMQIGSLGEEPDMSSGRKRYSKPFLLSFRDMEICKSLPPAIEVATLSALAFTGDRQASSTAAQPDREWKSNRVTSGGPPGMRGGRQGSGRMRGPVGIDADIWERGKTLPPMPGVGYGGRGPPPGMRMPGGPLPALHKSESAYKMGRVTTDDPEEEKAQKALKSMLNKITPQNFAKITAQIIDKINERKKAKTLQGFIDQIFDKALTETTFAELYADLVSKLNPALPSLEDEEGNPVQFRRTLLNKCQEEFETGSLAMQAVAEREKREQSREGGEEQEEAEKQEELEEGEITDVEKEMRDAAAEAKRQDKEAAEAEVKARKRMLGNIIFVGQLYRFGVLTESIMHTCIKTLLTETEHPRPEDIECLCKLLATVGRSMDSSERVVKAGGDESTNATTKEMMGAYFRRIEALMKNEALDSRHRFMLADLVDLRKNNWVQRLKAEGPKKIEDIHRDAAMERSRSQMLDRQMSRSRNDLRAARPPYDNRVDAPIRTLNRVGSQDSFSGQGQSFRPGGRPPPPSRPAPPQPERPSTPSPAEESAEKPAAGPVDVERKVKGMLEEVFNGGDDFKEGFLSIQELLDAGTDDRVIVEQCFNISLEMKGTDWDKFSAFLVQASESLSVSAMEGGSRQLLNKLDDLSVDVPKAPLQIGKVIANLIAADRLPTVAIMAKHIKEADAEPEEGEEPLAIGSGVAAKVLGTLLQSLKGHELDVAAAWKESGFAVLEFLPEEDRNDEGVEKFASTYDIADVLSA